MKGKYEGSFSRTWRSRLTSLVLAVGTSCVRRSDISPGGYWKCGESSGNLEDSSGNGNTAIAHGTITYGVIPGPIQDDATTAVTATNGTNYFSVASASSLPSGDVLTYSAWVKCSAHAASTTYNIVNQDAGSAGHLSATVALYGNGTGNTIYLDAWNGSVATHVAHSSVNITDTTTWHHVVVTKNGAATYIYLDGVDVTTADTNETIGPTDASMGFLQYSNGALSLGQFAVYKTALTAQQVLNLYNYGKHSHPLENPDKR